MKLNVSLHDIPYAKEDRIHKDIFTLESRRSIIYQKKDEGFLESAKQVEVEVCYLQRELEIRKSRKIAHAEYMQKKMRGRSERINKNSRDNRARNR